MSNRATGEIRPAIEVPELTEDFQGDNALNRLAQFVCDKHNDLLGHVGDYQIEYLWKKKGGKRLGANRMGACGKPSGLLKHYAATDFVIWLAADHLREENYTQDQIEALMFHELSHIAVPEEDESGDLTPPKLAPHDFEGFVADVERYGFWEPSLKRMGRAVQLRLTFDEEGT